MSIRSKNVQVEVDRLIDWLKEHKRDASKKVNTGAPATLISEFAIRRDDGHYHYRDFILIPKGK